MTKMTLRLVRVDHNGFCGRDFHPDDDMIGQTVRVTKMVTYDGDSNEELNLADPEQAGGTDHDYTVFFGVTEDGRAVEVMDHEAEVVEFVISA